MNFARLQMTLFSGLVGIATVAGLIYTYTVPMPSLQVTADGAPHFAPLVMHPETGDGIPLDTLIRHYKGL